MILEHVVPFSSPLAHLNPFSSAQWTGIFVDWTNLRVPYRVWPRVILKSSFKIATSPPNRRSASYNLQRASTSSILIISVRFWFLIDWFYDNLMINIDS